MNYQRIYNEFIADRQTKVIDCYCESHHIVPSHLGGTDTEDNLINLTPSDHLFAHLLLAKIHGGAMWLAVKMMCEIEPTKSSKRQSLITNKRRRFAFAKMRVGVAKYYSDNYSGVDSPNADQEIHILKHTDGREIKGNRFTLAEQMNTGDWDRQGISNLIRGGCPIYKGWYYPTLNPTGVSGVESLKIKRVEKSKNDDNKVYVYDEDKNKFFVNRYEFEQMTKENLSWYRLFKNTWTCGYTLDNTTKTQRELELIQAQKATEARGDISGANNPRADHKTYEFHFYPTGEVFIGTRDEFVKHTGLKASHDVQRIVASKHALIKGWRLSTNTLPISNFAKTMAMKLVA